MSLNSSSALTVTLPTDANIDIGFSVKFIVQTANDNAYTIKTGDIADSGGDDMVGGVILASTTAGFAHALLPAANDCNIVLDANLADTDSAMSLNAVGNSTNEESAFEFNIVNPSNGSTFAKYWFNGVTRDNSARVAHHNGGGMYEATDDIDGLKIFQSSGNLSGTVKLYGLKGS